MADYFLKKVSSLCLDRIKCRQMNFLSREGTGLGEICGNFHPMNSVDKSKENPER